MTHRIAVIGAGFAGLSCARVLRRAGFFVDLYEADRVVGGRMGTSRLGVVPFDHGAQYLTGAERPFPDLPGRIGAFRLWSGMAAEHCRRGS